MTTSQLVNYLGVKRQRFRVWIDQKAFGAERHGVGSGNRRTFTLSEVVYANILKDVLDLTQARSIRRILPNPGELLRHISRFISSERIERVRRRSSSLGQDGGWIIIERDSRNQFTSRLEMGARTGTPKHVVECPGVHSPCIVIPISGYCREAKKAFPDCLEY